MTVCVCDGVCVCVCVCMCVRERERMGGCGDMQGKVFRLRRSFILGSHTWVAVWLIPLSANLHIVW